MKGIPLPAKSIFYSNWTQTAASSLKLYRNLNLHYCCVGNYQCSGLSRKSCRSWSEFWKIQTLICKEMCKKLLVLTKSCWFLTDGPALVSNTNFLLSEVHQMCHEVYNKGHSYFTDWYFITFFQLVSYYHFVGKFPLPKVHQVCHEICNEWQNYFTNWHFIRNRQHNSIGTVEQIKETNNM